LLGDHGADVIRVERLSNGAVLTECGYNGEEIDVLAASGAVSLPAAEGVAS
jgi:crotonobetainyl-CoA:carnitine CoA-transferase CaiB-like acyl-CoA transferase